MSLTVTALGRTDLAGADVLELNTLSIIEVQKVM